MRAGRLISIAVVSFASLIVLATTAIGIFLFGHSRETMQQNFAPPAGEAAVAPLRGGTLFSQASGSSSFLYRRDPSSGKDVRLTAAPKGIESEASFSHNGKLIVYSFATSPESKSAIWLVDADGHNARMLTGEDEDALHPVFSPDDSKVFYGASTFTGNHSPIARPARHDWDLFSVSVQASKALHGTGRTQITHTSFYDLQSLDAAADEITPGGIKLLISTTGYPIGALMEEFNLGSVGGEKLFQPHVSDESSTGPAYGEARFLDHGMTIIFLAATEPAHGGNYDYNVYSMSDVTGKEIKQLTHLRGMTEDLRVLPGGKATFFNGGAFKEVDASPQTVKSH